MKVPTVGGKRTQHVVNQSSAEDCCMLAASCQAVGVLLADPGLIDSYPEQLKT